LSESCHPDLTFPDIDVVTGFYGLRYDKNSSSFDYWTLNAFRGRMDCDPIRSRTAKSYRTHWSWLFQKLVRSRLQGCSISNLFT
jgi:hypothetical protein